ncbi:MAG: hypothetical protein P1U40_10050 [Coxiellaceae bacterium]|nr:hypothetical protein [Coxiellaceae bacterium]
MRKILTICAAVAALGFGLTADLTAAPAAGTTSATSTTNNSNARRARTSTGRGDRQASRGFTITGAITSNASGGAGTSAVSQGASAATS